MNLPLPDSHTLDDPRKLLELLQGLTRAANRSENLTVGPGLTVHRTAGAVAIGLGDTKKQVVGSSVAEDCSGGTETVLGSAQGSQDSDTWTRDTDKTPVALTVITDIQYSTTSHQLTYRTRKLHFDKCGNLKAVDAEGDLIVITTAEVCT